MNLSQTLRLIACLLFAAPLLNASEDPQIEAPPPFEVPARQGSITAYHPGKPGRDQHLVVMIQDLHANVGVQKNIAAILYRLQRRNKMGMLLVCVEGASGEGDVSLLRSLPGPVRHGFEAMLLRRAYLTGAELAATEAAADWSQQQVVIWDRIKGWFVRPKNPGPVSLSPIQLWGVDDPELYRTNWRAAKKVDRQHYAALNFVRGLRADVSGGGGPLAKHLELLTRLLLLRLQPHEYKEYLATRRLNPKGPPIFQDTVAAAETYYQAAEDRSVAMANNLLAKIKYRPGITALITGGFHTQEIADVLKARSVPYMVITPHVQVLDQDEAYRSRLREEE